MIHAARTIPFATLLKGLEDARAAGHVSRKLQPTTGLSLYCYTQPCVYERAWNEFSILARGLILDELAERVVATPFPKFFNLGECEPGFPDMPFEVFEKLDGSLIIIYHHNGYWRAATKGSFSSSQAQWAQDRLARSDLTVLEIGTTYLAEGVYPENRIVVLYSNPALVMLGAYREDGGELNYAELLHTCERLGWRPAVRYPYDAISDLVVRAKTLPSDDEGYVIRFADGYRLKVKGDEYRRVHALISNCTPLAMWAALAAGDDMEALRRDLPEEFWADFDGIIGTLESRVSAIKAVIAKTATEARALSDKELGLTLRDLPGEAQPFIFTYRKTGGVFDDRMMEKLWRMVRPTANVLPGYTPSYAINRVMEEA